MRLSFHSDPTFASKYRIYLKFKRGGSNYPQVTYGNTTLSEGQQICNAFNQFFKDAFSTSTQKQPQLVIIIYFIKWQRYNITSTHISVKCGETPQ